MHTSENSHFQSAETYKPASGSADWSKIAHDEELTKIFNQEENIQNIPASHVEQASAVHHSNEESSLSFTQFSKLQSI